MTPQLITLYEAPDGRVVVRPDRGRGWALEDAVGSSRFDVDAPEWLAGRWTPQDDFRRRDWSASKLAAGNRAVATWHIAAGLTVHAMPNSTSVALYLGVEPAAQNGRVGS
jgi:hypothetical protein